MSLDSIIKSCSWRMFSQDGQVRVSQRSLDVRPGCDCHICQEQVPNLRQCRELGKLGFVDVIVLRATHTDLVNLTKILVAKNLRNHSVPGGVGLAAAGGIVGLGAADGDVRLFIQFTIATPLVVISRSGDPGIAAIS